jgi:hypothetical protein
MIEHLRIIMNNSAITLISLTKLMDENPVPETEMKDESLSFLGRCTVGCCQATNNGAME